MSAHTLGGSMTTLNNRPNTALLVIDLQNGVVAGAHNRDEVVANAGTLIDRARAAEVAVIWVQHNSAELIEGGEAWRYVPELVRNESEPLV
ncbi:MAG: isochorismatase family protein, partial [Sciscionella sp.]